VQKTPKTPKTPKTQAPARRETRAVPQTRLRPAPTPPRILPYPGGLLGPHQVVTLTINPPLGDHEQPVLVTPKAGDVLIQEAGLDSVIIANQTDRSAAFVVTAAPRVLVRAAAVPWGQVFRDLGAAVQESGVLDQLKGLFRRPR